MTCEVRPTAPTPAVPRALGGVFISPTSPRMTRRRESQGEEGTGRGFWWAHWWGAGCGIDRPLNCPLRHGADEHAPKTLLVSASPCDPSSSGAVADETIPKRSAARSRLDLLKPAACSPKPCEAG